MDYAQKACLKLISLGEILQKSFGCFLSGCCYGIESSFGFYLNYSPAPGCA